MGHGRLSDMGHWLLLKLTCGFRDPHQGPLVSLFMSSCILYLSLINLVPLQQALLCGQIPFFSLNSVLLVDYILAQRVPKYRIVRDFI